MDIERMFGANSCANLFDVYKNCPPEKDMNISQQAEDLEKMR